MMGLKKLMKQKEKVKEKDMYGDDRACRWGKEKRGGDEPM